jgi:hypothetical protein
MATPENIVVPSAICGKRFLGGATLNWRAAGLAGC